MILGALLNLPFFVEIKITPFEPRAPYIAVEAASFNTSIEDISSGVISFMLRSTPSTNTKGSLLWVIEEPPLTFIENPPPGVLFVCTTRTPEIRPFSPSTGEEIDISLNTSPFTLEIEEVIVRLEASP